MWSITFIVHGNLTNPDTGNTFDTALRPTFNLFLKVDGNLDFKGTIDGNGLNATRFLSIEVGGTTTLQQGGIFQVNGAGTGNQGGDIKIHSVGNIVLNGIVDAKGTTAGGDITIWGATISGDAPLRNQATGSGPDGVLTLKAPTLAAITNTGSTPVTPIKLAVWKCAAGSLGTPRN